MTLKLRAGVSSADVEYGIALLDEDRGEYWNLNPTGALILRTLLSGGTAKEAAEALADEYGIDVDAATQDVHDLVADLRSARLIEE